MAISFRELFLLQKVLELSKMRLTMRVELVQLEFPHSAECVKGLCPFETHHLLKKVDENFCFHINRVCGRENHAGIYHHL